MGREQRAGSSKQGTGAWRGGIQGGSEPVARGAWRTSSEEHPKKMNLVIKAAQKFQRTGAGE